MSTPRSSPQEEKPEKTEKAERSKGKQDKDGGAPNGSIQVVARVRPLSNSELTKGHETALVIDAENGAIQVAGNAYHNRTRAFCLHKVFPQESRQADIFETCVSPLMDDVLLGYNVCVFAYGQTGSGKTYTMEGPPMVSDSLASRTSRRNTAPPESFSPSSAVSHPELRRQSSSGALGSGSVSPDRRRTIQTDSEHFPFCSEQIENAAIGGAEVDGIIQRSVAALYERLEKSHRSQYEVSVSHLEIYNEEMYDLMSASEDPATPTKSSGRPSVAGGTRHAGSGLRLEEDSQGLSTV